MKIVNSNFYVNLMLENAHYGVIFDIYLKDKNTFETCSEDKSIKIWKKQENGDFMLYKFINDIHKIIVLEDDTIRSSSKDEITKFLNLVY